MKIELRWETIAGTRLLYYEFRASWRWDEFYEVKAKADRKLKPFGLKELVALTQEVLRNFRNPDGSLAVGIALANRAEEEFGDIGELGFERDVASIYQDALSNINVNYPEAIRLLVRVMSLAPNYKDASSLLFSQYVAYGDALCFGDGTLPGRSTI